VSDLNFSSPPQSICIVRLSAIGDVAHVIAVVNRLQTYWPHIKITWIIGKIEYQLVKNMPNIKFIIFDKNNNFGSYQLIYQALKNTKFDILLMLQAALRASVISLIVSANYKIGFDKARSRDAQWLFSNKRITGPERVHVVDAFFQFLSLLGIPDSPKTWDLTLDPQAIRYADDIIKKRACVVINPNSSVTRRNWSIEGYARIIDFITMTLDKQVILSGAPNPKEMAFNQAILNQCTAQKNIIDLTAKTQLQELAAVIKQAELVIAPDTGPAHIATAVNTPVISLFADTNPKRARPYLSESWVVSEYEAALKSIHNTKVEEAKWGARSRQDGVMDLIHYQRVEDMVSSFYSCHNQ